MVYDQRFNDAYRTVFQKGDEATLIKLLGRTGVVIEDLSNENLDKVLNSITSFLNQRAYVDVILPWIQKLAVNMAHFHERLYKLTLKSMEDAIVGLLRSETLDQEKTERLDHAYN